LGAGLFINLDYVPLLRIMRELHSILRGQPPDFNGMKRFRQYVRTIFPRDRLGQVRRDENAVYLLPLLAMNPMGKDHVTALLDAYLAMDADGIGARAAAEAAARLADVPGDFKVGLVVADDLMGAGTNRYDCEFAWRFGPRPLPSPSAPPKPPRWLKDFWLQGTLWSSESPSEQGVREGILTAAHRVAYMHQHGLVPLHRLHDLVRLRLLDARIVSSLADRPLPFIRSISGFFLRVRGGPCCQQEYSARLAWLGIYLSTRSARDAFPKESPARRQRRRGCERQIAASPTSLRPRRPGQGAT
jgi:hypothetical protein